MVFLLWVFDQCLSEDVGPTLEGERKERGARLTGRGFLLTAAAFTFWCPLFFCGGKCWLEIACGPRVWMWSREDPARLDYGVAAWGRRIGYGGSKACGLPDTGQVACGTRKWRHVDCTLWSILLFCFFHILFYLIIIKIIIVFSFSFKFIYLGVKLCGPQKTPQWMGLGDSGRHGKNQFHLHPIRIL